MDAKSANKYLTEEYEINPEGDISTEIAYRILLRYYLEMPKLRRNFESGELEEEIRMDENVQEDGEAIQEHVDMVLDTIKKEFLQA